MIKVGQEVMITNANSLHDVHERDGGRIMAKRGDGHWEVLINRTGLRYSIHESCLADLPEGLRNERKSKGLYVSSLPSMFDDNWMKKRFLKEDA